MKATVTEIHDYPHRPAGFAEPLFWGLENKREAMEHFLAATWVHRASELATSRGSGEAAHARRESVRIGCREDGTRFLERRCGRSGSSGRRRGHRSIRSVREVLDCWREVRGWWASGGEDLVVYRLMLSDGAILDVAKDPRDRSGEDWELVGVVD